MRLINSSGVSTSSKHGGRRERLKHAIDHTHMKMHMRVQAGAEAVNESDCAQVQVGRVYLCRTGAMGLQALLNEPVYGALRVTRSVRASVHAGQQRRISSRRRGVDGNGLLCTKAVQVVRATGLGTGTRQAFATKGLHPHHRANHVAVDIDVAPLVSG